MVDIQKKLKMALVSGAANALKYKREFYEEKEREFNELEQKVLDLISELSKHDARVRFHSEGCEIHLTDEEIHTSDREDIYEREYDKDTCKEKINPV